MSFEFGKKRKKEECQSWKPNGFLRFLRGLWIVAFAALKIAVGAVATVLCICVVCGLVFVGLLGNFLQNDIAPEAEGFTLDAYSLDQTSYVYYTDSNDDIQLLQRIYTSTDRRWAGYDQIPKDLIRAAVAIEDKRFFEHQGVDWITTIKACANIFFGSRSTFGGSTITQQLIKNVTGDDSVTVQRKVLEIFKAQELEKHYDKDLIMEWYLNTIYLGEGCWGVKSAAATYFGKELEMLTTAECASLISITNNPSYYDPYNVDPESDLDGAANNRERQEDTLWAMKDQGWLTEEEYNEAMAQEMVFKAGISEEDKLVTCSNEACGYKNVKKTFTTDEAGNVFCPVCGTQAKVDTDASRGVYSWFVDTVLEDVAQDLAAQQGVEWADETREIYMNKIKQGGYHIYTTLDMDVQNQVDAIYTNLDEIPTARSGQQLQSAIVVQDNVTGDIVAMAGGVGEKEVHDAYNRATEAMLQTGSSMKPLTVYAPGFEMGAISPATVIRDMPLSYDYGPFPRNDDYSYSYSRTIYDAVTHSVNAVAVNVLDLIGTGYSYEFAKEKFGLSTLTDHYETSSGGELSDVGYSPLGMGALTVGCSVRDMTAAFATFANHGTFREGRTYTKVYDSDGNLILSNEQDSRKILSEKTVDYMNYCLQSAVERGTGGAAYISGMDVAGKTGSTDSFKDRWFCGFSGYYTAAVWVGYDTPEQIYLTGNTSNPACRLWNKVMEPLHAGKETIPLYSYDMSSVSVCLDSGKIATDACTADIRGGRVETVHLYREDYPTQVCDKHIAVEYCEKGHGVANEYCKKFAEAKQTEITKKSLVKMTQNEIDELLQVEGYGLSEEYLRDDYIYYVDGSGNPLNFKGIHGDANVGVNAPYVTCTLHTKATWDAYVASHGGGTKPGTGNKPGAGNKPGITFPGLPKPGEGGLLP